MWLANHASEWIHGDSFALLTPAFAAKYAHKLHAILLFQGFVFYTGIKPKAPGCTARSRGLSMLWMKKCRVYGTNRYPTPRMVMICCGVRALSSILLRRRLMYTMMALSSTAIRLPQICS